jgi:hypothetical protein
MKGARIMVSEKRLIYVEDVIALFEKDIADSWDALKTAWPGDKDEIRAEMNGVRAALHILKHHASHGGTVDAVEVVHGRWEDVYGGKYANPRYMCSVCKEKSLYTFVRGLLGGYEKMQALTAYCPNCGVKMDKEKDNDI